MSYDKTYVEFHNGYKMPIFGIGTADDDERLDLVKLAIKIALDAGYRHIDTAFIYKNEDVIGDALQEIFAEGKYKREDIFVVTKLPPHGMRPSDVKYFLTKSLKNLKLDYVDLYLIHWCYGLRRFEGRDEDPFSKAPDGKSLIDVTTDLVAVWKEMETMVKLGLTKSIGVSNFAASQIQRILDVCEIKPANNQIECHIYFQRNNLVDFCHKNDITVCAYAPIGSPGLSAAVEKLGFKVTFPHALSDPVITEIAKKHNKEPAHVLLKFLMQRGIVVIPKSVNPDRIKSNFNVFDFKLSEADMESIKKLDRNARFFTMNLIPGEEAHPEYVTAYLKDE